VLRARPMHVQLRMQEATRQQSLPAAGPVNPQPGWAVGVGYPAVVKRPPAAPWLGTDHQPRRRLISKAAIDAATATFSDSTWLRMGMRSRTSGGIVDPWVSPPNTSTARGASSV
jgi:hypothetical protein